MLSVFWERPLHPKRSLKMVSVAQREAAKELGVENGVLAVESYLHYSHYSNAVFQKAGRSIITNGTLWEVIVLITTSK